MPLERERQVGPSDASIWDIDTAGLCEISLTYPEYAIMMGANTQKPHASSEG